MKSDWFAVYRQLLESDLWLAESFTRGQAWVDLIGLARWKAGFLRVRGAKIDLDRGELGWSELSLAARWSWSRGKVRRFLKELERSQQIVQQKLPQTSRIRIVNYNAYQCDGTADSTPGEHPTGHPTDNQRAPNDTRKNKGKKEKGKNHPPPTPSSQATTETEWLAVEGELLTEGVARAADCIAGARAGESSPKRVRGIVDHWRNLLQAIPGRWKSAQAVLHSRLMIDRPQLAIDDGWPPADGAAVRKVADAERRQSVANTDAANSAQLSLEEIQKAERVKRYGPEWDGLPNVKRITIAKQLLTAGAFRMLAKQPTLLMESVFLEAEHQNLTNLLPEPSDAA